MDEVYKQFTGTDLILRDQLAIDRTVLANERTLLSFIRTSLAIAAVGGTIIHFGTIPLHYMLGFFFILLSAIMLLVGLKRYITVRSHIRILRNQDKK